MRTFHLVMIAWALSLILISAKFQNVTSQSAAGEDRFYWSGEFAADDRPHGEATAQSGDARHYR